MCPSGGRRPSSSKADPHSPPMAADRLIEAVIFDWGDTLMRVTPGETGPMAEWPELVLVPDVEPTLAALKGRWLLAVGSNAGPSDAPLMRRAFRRVGLDAYFDALFTHVELAALKPERRFFIELARRLDKEPGRCVFVGDDFNRDVVGAKAAGMKAVWFSPDWETAQIGGCHPADAVIPRLSDLPELVAAWSRPVGEDQA